MPAISTNGIILRERGRLLGRKLAFYDATLSAGDTAPDWPDAEDPVLPGFVPAFTSAMTALYREKLGWRVDDLYETLNGAGRAQLELGSRRCSRPSALGDLGQMLALDPDFRVAGRAWPDRRAGALFRLGAGTGAPAAVQRAGAADVRRLSRRAHVLHARRLAQGAARRGAAT